MHGNLSPQDQQFKAAVESGAFPVDQFDHRAHLRLAYIYLAETSSVAASVGLVKKTLWHLLEKAGVQPQEKYHATLTQAWLHLVARHMQPPNPACEDTEDFISQHATLLDTKLLLGFYSEARLYSEAARAAFLTPDVTPLLNTEREK